MLTTEREIKSRNERYGAFESKPEKMMAQIGFVEEKNNAVQSFNNIRSVDSYSTDFDMQTSVKYGAIIKPATKRLNVSDAYVEKAKSEKNLTAGVAPRDRVRFKNVAMICAYVLVVAALIAVIVLNSSAISSVSSMNAKLSSEITQLQAARVSAVEEIEALSSESRIAELAITNLGLTEATAQTVEMTIPSYNPSVEAVKSTNWFDTFCDSINNMFRG
ncbi:MAG: hypothetical protein IKA18_02530 [Clostridia bacterium]|nr:hypothetical protein [Clostridia bacterium]MBR2069810.1 hypothetical protein [Clostridia bacterium]